VSLINMRVSMPDRTGMLATVASALSEASADIVTIDVVHHADGLVVDDLCIDIKATTPSALRRRVEEVPGVVVEVVRSVDAPPTSVDALELAQAVVENHGDHRVEVLVEGLPAALGGEWAMALELHGDGVRLICASARAPGPPEGIVPWMPLAAPRRLAVAPWMPTSWRLRSMVTGLEVAASPLSLPTKAVAVARSSGRFRPPELRQLEILAHLAIRDSQVSSPEPVPTAIG